MGKKWPVQMNLPFFAVEAYVPGGVQNQAEKNAKKSLPAGTGTKITFPEISPAFGNAPGLSSKPATAFVNVSETCFRVIPTSLAGHLPQTKTPSPNLGTRAQAGALDASFLLTVEVFLLTVRLFYLRWGNRNQKRPNPIS